MPHDQEQHLDEVLSFRAPFDNGLCDLVVSRLEDGDFLLTATSELNTREIIQTDDLEALLGAMNEVVSESEPAARWQVFKHFRKLVECLEGAGIEEAGRRILRLRSSLLNRPLLVDFERNPKGGYRVTYGNADHYSEAGRSDSLEALVRAMNAVMNSEGYHAQVKELRRFHHSVEQGEILVETFERSNAMGM